MADLATPSAAAMSTMDAGASTPPVNGNKDKDRSVVSKPERPDQETYEKDLAKAQKDLDTAVQRQVRPASLTRMNQWGK